MRESEPSTTKGKKMSKTYKVQADTINGIFLVASLDDYEGCEVLSFADFVEELDGLEAGVIIGCTVTEAQLELLDDECGVAAHPGA